MVLQPRLDFVLHAINAGRLVLFSVSTTGHRLRIKLILESAPVSDTTAFHDYLRALVEPFAALANSEGVIVVDRGHMHHPGRSEIKIYYDVAPRSRRKRAGPTAATLAEDSSGDDDNDDGNGGDEFKVRGAGRAKLAQKGSSAKLVPAA
eukprot:3787276-Amphidinium_carterae.1